MKLSNEVKIGITVFLAFVAAILGFRFMSGLPILSQSQQFVTHFDRVDGISPGSIVYVNGVKVGSVNRLSLEPDGKVQINLRIDKGVKIPEGSVAYLTSQGIVEGKSIIIEYSDSNQILESGDQIDGIYVDSMMEVLSRQGEEIGSDASAAITELNQFLRQLNQTLNDETRTTLDETLQNASKATSEVAYILQSRKGEISEAIISANDVLKQLDSLAIDNRPKLDSLVTALQRNVEELDVLRTELELATGNLNQILEKVNNGDGTIGRLVNDPSVYENLDSLSIELTRLVKGMNDDPGRYLKHMSIIEIF